METNSWNNRHNKTQRVHCTRVLSPLSKVSGRLKRAPVLGDFEYIR